MPDPPADSDSPVGGIGQHHRRAGTAGTGAEDEGPPGVPHRTCIGCRRVAAQEALVRVVRLADGTLATGRALPGRGAWLCAGSVACIDEAIKRKAFGRAFRAPVAPGAADPLRAEAVRCARMGGRSTGRTEERDRPDVT